MKKATAVLLLFIIALCLFFYTVEIRRPWFGILGGSQYQWTTGSSLIVAKNWYREGILHLKCAMVYDPPSVESPTMETRMQYVSFPPGARIPLYLASVLISREPTPSLAMGLNLLNQLFIAFFLALTILFFLEGLGLSRLKSFGLSTVPLFFCLLMPLPLYYFQNVYGTDMIVLLPFVLFVFLEVLREDAKKRKALFAIGALQWLLIFYGTLTDWLFLVVAATVWTTRLLNGRMGRGFRTFVKRSFTFWLPAACAVGLFLLQVASLGLLGRLVSRFFFRTGISTSGGRYVTDFCKQFWQGHIVKGFGEAAVGIIWASAALFLLSCFYLAIRRLRGKPVGKDIKKTVSLMGILLVPCFLQVYLLRNHSVIHAFSALKFMLPLGTVPFVLLPVLIVLIIRNSVKTELPGRGKCAPRGFIRKALSVAGVPFILLCVVTFVSREHVRFASLFPKPEISLPRIGSFISKNTAFEDVVFSPTHKISNAPAQALSYSMKNVYKINSLHDIDEKVRGLDGNYNIALFLQADGGMDDYYGIRELINASYESRGAGDLKLWRIAADDFRRVFKRLESDLPRRVEKELSKCKETFDIYQLMHRFSFTEDTHPRIYERLRGEFEESIKRCGTGTPLNDRVSFVDFFCEKIGRDRYRAFFLFRANRELPDDFRIFFHGRVSEDNVCFLSPYRRQFGFENWDFDPELPTSAWPVGEGILLSRELTAKPIPYDLSFGFFKPGKDYYGKRFHLGWRRLDE